MGRRLKNDQAIWGFWVNFILGTCLLFVSHGYAFDQINWLTGASFQRQLQVPVTATMQGLSFRKGVQRFSTQQKIACLVDRRANPNSDLVLQLSSVPLNQAFVQLASQQNLSACQIGSVIYIGPAEMTAKLPAVISQHEQEILRQPASSRALWNRKQSLSWNDLDSPREILTGILDQAKLKVSNIEVIPHDLWAAADLPELSLIERVMLVCAQFDLSYQIDANARTITLIPCPEVSRLQQDYPIGENPGERLAQFRELAPNSTIKRVGSKFQVEGPPEEHVKLQQATQQSTATNPTAPSQANQRYTLRVKNKPLETVLQVLSKNLGLTLKMDRNAVQTSGVKLDQMISFEVKDATVDGLFQEVLKTTTLKHQLKGKTLEVTAK